MSYYHTITISLSIDLGNLISDLRSCYDYKLSIQYSVWVYSDFYYFFLIKFIYEAKA